MSVYGPGSYLELFLLSTINVPLSKSVPLSEYIQKLKKGGRRPPLHASVHNERSLTFICAAFPRIRHISSTNQNRAKNLSGVLYQH